MLKRLQTLSSVLSGRRDNDSDRTFPFHKDDDDTLEMSGWCTLCRWESRDGSFNDAYFTPHEHEAFRRSKGIKSKRKITEDDQARFESAVNEKVDEKRKLLDTIPMRKIERLDRHVIKDVFGGFQTSICVTNTKDLWVFGRGGCGQLGLGKIDAVGEPECMTLARWTSKTQEAIQARVVYVAVGYRHTLVQLEDKIYVWGDNRFGQLGHEPSSGTILCVPSTLYLPPSIKVRKVVTGAVHSVILSMRGAVYTFGDGTSTFRTILTITTIARAHKQRYLRT